jgi:hypothetical protein
MKVYKFNTRKKVKLSFLAQLGMETFDGELIFNKSIDDIPPVTLELEGLTLLKIVNFESRKLIYADFLETVYPLVLWSGEEYESNISSTKERIEERIKELINSSKKDYVSELFSITAPVELELSNEEYVYIQKKYDFEFPVLPESLIIRPKRPVLPPLKTI